MGWGGSGRKSSLSPCRGTTAPILLPAPRLASPKGTADLSEGDSHKSALLGHADLEQLALERSFCLRKPSSETKLDVTAFVVSSLPQHCQEKGLMGHEINV